MQHNPALCNTTQHKQADHADQCSTCGLTLSIAGTPAAAAAAILGAAVSGVLTLAGLRVSPTAVSYPTGGPKPCGTESGGETETEGMATKGGKLGSKTCSTHINIEVQ